MKDNDLIFGTEYIVQKGDSLYSIATRFGTTVDKLMKLNKLENDSLIIGQVLIIDDIFSPGKPSVYKEYVVQEGDTLAKLAYLFNMSIINIKALNKLESDVLKEGQILTVKNVEEKSPKKIYIVQKGDSLHSIAKKNNMSVEEIKKLNDLKSNLINVNDKIILDTGILEEKHPEDFYTILPGDSLYSIATKYKTTVENLKKLNNLNSNNLKVGSQIIIK